MLLGEPPPTNYDLHFNFGPFLVRIHPFFWLVTLIMGVNSRDAISILSWIVACFASILIHELGHAVTMRWYGESPRVLLYGMGGLAMSDGGYARGWGGNRRGGRTAWEQIVISFAGPAAGFLFALVILVFVVAMKGQVAFRVPSVQSPAFWSAKLANFRLLELVSDLLYINFAWGLVNLLPIFPLDGGQIARQLLVLAEPGSGYRRSLGLSVATAAAMSFVGFAMWKSMYVGFMFAWLAVESYMSMQRR